jgi:hypothetical protein
LGGCGAYGIGCMPCIGTIIGGGPICIEWGCAICTGCWGAPPGWGTIVIVGIIGAIIIAPPLVGLPPPPLTIIGDAIWPAEAGADATVIGCGAIIIGAIGTMPGG